MRLGVSAKVFLAYAVLLVAFAANSIFGLVYFHHGWQEMLANQHRLEVQLAVDPAYNLLERDGAVMSRVVDASTRIGLLRTQLQLAVRTVDQYLEQSSSLDASRRSEFLGYRARLDSITPLVEAWRQDGGSRPSESHTRLVRSLGQLKRDLQQSVRGAAREVSQNEERSVRSAVVFGALGLCLAVLAALFILRTLRPLRALREAARRIAGGEYTRRVGIESRDEIGDLAREFDAMAQALEEREQRLIRSERLATVGRMAAQITHEIRNPLASIGLYVELLGEDLGARDEDARRLVASIGKEVDRLSEITESYLRFVRLPRPKLALEEPGAMVSSVLEFSRAELAAVGIRLLLEIQPNLPEVPADENQIRQALLNLVRNAREAMPSGGELHVSVRGDRREVRVALADTGPGIAAEDLSKIFDPFFSTKAKGTGLGLALVQQIAAEHGGRIEVANQPGGGTRFELVLPVAPRLVGVGEGHAPTGIVDEGEQAAREISGAAPTELAYPEGR